MSNNENKKENKKGNNLDTKDEKNNKLLMKLNETAEKEFQKYIVYLGLPDNSNDKESFIKFLFNDVLTVQVPYASISISEIVEDSSSIIDNYFDKVQNKNNFNNLLNTIKLKFIQKKKILKEKIKECNEHLKMIKNEFINVELENVITNKNNTSKKFTFLNKKVLIYPETNKLNYALSEIFARYIFTSITNNATNIPANSIIDTFYEDSKINSFIDDPSTPTAIKPFINIDNNFKYWIFIIFLISTLFASNSDYSILFNHKEFEKLIDKLVVLKSQKKKDGQGDGKKKKKKKGQSGGGKKGTASLLQAQAKSKGQSQGQQQKKKNGENKKKNVEESSEKKLYKEIFNKCYITFQLPSPLNNQNLQQIYNGDGKGTDNKYISIIKNYFTQNPPFNNILSIAPTSPPELGNTSAKSALRNIQSIPNLFLPQEDKAKIKIDINDIGKKNSDIKLEMVKSYVNNIIKSFDIFQSLRMLQDKNNYDEIKNFTKELRKKLILLLYNLYKFKKSIYEKFIERLNEVFFEENNNINNNQNNSSSNNENSRNKTNTGRSKNTSSNSGSPKIKDNFNYNSVNNNIKNNVVHINKEIIALQSKLKNLNQDNSNYEKKSFEIQEKINELYAKRYVMISNA
jgi:hypothetical protein